MLLEFYVLFIGKYTSVMLEDEGVILIANWTLFWLLNPALLKFDMGILLTLIANKSCDLHLRIDL